MSDYIYLDNNATTPLDPLVLKEMLKDLGPPLNPSSIHGFGKKAHLMLIEARAKIASCLKVKTDEVIFTSGGTEALNMLIRGLSTLGSHIITTDIEHACIYNTVLDLQKKCRVTFLKTNGAPTVEQIEDALLEDTKLLIFSAVNSETGVLLDLEKVALLAKEKNIPLIIDGVALLGKKEFTIPEGVTAMAFSPHKIHGPKGVGIVYLSSHARLKPLLLGGSQEWQKRAGTENLAGIIGSAKAVELAYQNIHENVKKIELLRDLLENELSKRLGIEINGGQNRICNTSNIAFLGLDAEELLMRLDINKIAASHGSACASHSMQVSRVLLNMGLAASRAKSSIRFSLSRLNTKEEIEKAVEIITKCAGES